VNACLKGLKVLFGLHLLNFALAHYLMEHALGGSRLCLDPSSVQVEVSGDGSVPDEALEAVIKRRLERYLPEAFSRYGVPFEERRSCSGSDGFVLVHLLVFHAGDGAGDGYDYTYTLSVQVGEHAVGAGLAVENSLTGSRYNFISSFIYGEAVTGKPFHSYLPSLGEAAARDLVAAWWLDNPIAGEAAGLPRRLGALIACGMALGSWLLARRRRR
jgi:hypothetical protein